MCSHPLYLLCVVTPFFFPRELCAGHLLPSETYCMRHFAHVHVKRLAAWITNQTTKKYTIVITSYLPVTKKSSRPTEEKKIGPISSPTQYAEPWLFEPPLRQWANLSGSESNTTWLTAERQYDRDTDTAGIMCGVRTEPWAPDGFPIKKTLDGCEPNWT